MPSSPSPVPSPQAPELAGDRLIVVVGPTASGKTRWGIDIAQRLKGEIVNIDSRQIYRRLDIGTAKPTRQHRELIPHHCIDLIDVTERFSLAEYLRAARTAIAEIVARGKRPIVVGGAGQHIRALREGWQVPPASPNSALRGQHLYFAFRRGRGALHHHLRQVDPAAAEAIPAGNLRRVSRALEVYAETGVPISEWQRLRAPLDSVVVAPQWSRAELDQRIADRAVQMFATGVVEETQALLDDGVPASAPGFESIGYRETIDLLRGRIDRDAAIRLVTEHTQRLARSQYKWFRPAAADIHWAASIPWQVLK